MSYERQNSTDRLEQYRARQAARIEAMNRAVDEGRTRVVSSNESPEPMTAKVSRDEKSPAKVKIEPIGRGDGVYAKSNHKQPNAGLIRPVARIVSQAVKRRMKVYGAAVIKPQDGEVFVYSSETGEIERLNYRVVKTGGYVRRFGKYVRAISSVEDTTVAGVQTALAGTLFKK